MKCEVALRVVSLPGDGQQHEEVVQLEVADLHALDLAVHVLADQRVVGLLALLLRERVRVHPHLDRDLHRIGAGLHLGIVVADQGVRPVEHLLAVFLRDAHQLTDQDQRKLAGQLGHELAASLARHVVDDAARVGTDARLELRDHARREAALDESAVLHVAGRVHVDQHRLEPGQVARAGVEQERGAHGRGEHVRVARDVDHVLVLRQHPVAAVELRAAVTSGPGSSCQQTGASWRSRAR